MVEISKVTKLIIAIHGNSRNVESLKKNMHEATVAAGMLSNTMIIVPLFRIASDQIDGEPYWTEDGWKQGDMSLSSKKISSFSMLDNIIKYTVYKNPCLTTIVVAGHSAGGQFVQRYAIGSPIEKVLPSSIKMSYVVANPGSYMYLDAIRPIHPTKRCADNYNNYKYGFDFDSKQRSHYMYTEDPTGKILPFMKKNVTYLLGRDDVKIDDELDTSCSANCQGPTRFLRGIYYFDAITRFGSNNHQCIIIPNVGHSATQIYRSEQARKALFE